MLSQSNAKHFHFIHLVLSKILPINFSCTYIRLHQIMRYYTFNSAPERNSVVVTLRFEGEQNKMISCDNRHYYFVIYIYVVTKKNKQHCIIRSWMISNILSDFYKNYLNLFLLAYRLWKFGKVFKSHTCMHVHVSTAYRKYFSKLR